MADFGVDLGAPVFTVGGAFNEGTRLDELRAMYRVLAAHIDSGETLARDLSPLMRQAREISVEIEELEAMAASAAEVAAEDVEGVDGEYSFDPSTV